MPTFALICGLLMTALGCVTMFAGPPPGVTSVLPAAIGAVFVILGLLARKPAWRKHVMHAAAMLAVIGACVAFPAAAGVFRSADGTPAADRVFVYTQAFMAGVCVVFLGAAVRSFIAARRAR